MIALEGASRRERTHRPLESGERWSSLRCAVPTSGDGGLDAPRSAHFGHAEYFTLAEVSEGTVVGSDVLANPPHSHGGCMMTVDLLVSRGVTAVAAIGMGGGPLAGLRAAGIEVFFEDASPTVRGAVEAVLSGRVTPFGGDHVCQGH